MSGGKSMAETLGFQSTKVKARVPATAALNPDLQNFAQDLFDTVREPMLLLNSELRIRSANAAFYRTFHMSAAETEGHLVYELSSGQWGETTLRNLLEQTVAGQSAIDDFVLEHDFPHIGHRIIVLNTRRLRTDLVLLAMDDVTERRRTRDVLEQIEAYAQDVVDTVREPLLILDSSLRVHSANRAFYQTFQVSSHETE